MFFPAVTANSNPRKEKKLELKHLTNKDISKLECCFQSLILVVPVNCPLLSLTHNINNAANINKPTVNHFIQLVTLDNLLNHRIPRNTTIAQSTKQQIERRSMYKSVKAPQFWITGEFCTNPSARFAFIQDII
jgi:hypothetical protein